MTTKEAANEFRILMLSFPAGFVGKPLEVIAASIEEGLITYDPVSKILTFEHGLQTQILPEGFKIIRNE
jgi:hypothetical protein